VSRHVQMCLRYGLFHHLYRLFWSFGLLPCAGDMASIPIVAPFCARFTVSCGAQGARGRRAS
jgi:hypothetical protein